MPGVWSILISSFGGFNPRPANWPGDAANLRTIERSLLVSIRARPIGRAMLYSRNVSLRKKIPVFCREPAPEDH
jgi:hypothetical protein